MRARIFCQTGELSGSTHQLLKAETIIGRAGDADVVISSELISGRHARIRQDKGGFVLEDLGSTNGTWIDGERVRDPVRLDRLNVITLAKEFDFIFQLAASEPARAAAAPAATAPKQPPPAAKAGTEVDREAFGPLPQLGAKPPAAATGSRTAEDIEGFGPLPGSKTGPRLSVSQPASRKPRTEADMEPVGPLPNLKAGESAPPPGAGKPRTEVDMESLAPLPELQKRVPAVPPPPLESGISTERGAPAIPGPTPAAGPPAYYAVAITVAGLPLQTFELKAGRYTFGRSDDSNFPLPDPEISRHHATLVVGQVVTVEDAGSSNGTHVDGRRIQQPTEVRPGSIIMLGATVSVKLIRR